ncbi:MAG: class I SAM-dependent DNA methyltransferase [Pyrinomonadaceae bacterium]|nr:class I SAM-dependent DNA methyltransferase [Pyrinomonadaceae bacterium]
MPRLSQQEIRSNAVKFAHEWKGESRERAEAQSFWNDFLNIFGIKRRRVAIFEKAVPKNNENTGAIDLFWKGVLLVEHKSLGKNFDKAESQAFEYLENLPENDLPELVLLSDFAKFRLYNLETNEEIEFLLEELPNHIHRFGAISGYQQRIYKEQDAVNIAVAMKLGELHDALLDSGYTGHKLEVFLVRLVYCLFADDTGIFLPRSSFLYFLEEKTLENGANLGAMLQLLFQILDTPESTRQSTIDEDLQQFPYVNGDLFRERMDLPFFDKKMRQILIEACSFDWSKVSPAIFGSLFQSVMDKDKRRNLGAHYTSEKNILKVIHGLFLDELYEEFETVKNNQNRLREFHEKISKLRYFDPACGSGNFLVITYREMRLLEIEILKRLRELTGNVQLELDISKISKIDVDAFYGIEFEEFPAEIARVALWLTDHQANMNLSAEFGLSFVRLPLRKSANIVHGNALRIDWSEVVSTDGSETETTLYILGNPPFIGKDKRTPEQTADMEFCCSDVNNFKTLDYVSAWFIKAAKFIENSKISVAFVSTNSITQGEQVGILWSYLLDKGVKIHFAHRTFKWNNEASGNAQVEVVISGFAFFDRKQKRLFDYQTPKSAPHEISVKNINPYLVDSADTVVTTRRKPLCDVPQLIYGNKPVDGGNLFLNGEKERAEFLAVEPNAEKFIRRIYGSEEFINGIDRFCLWLKDASPTEWRNLPAVVERVQAVRDFRLKSTKAATVKLAETPYLFAEIRQPESDFLIIPLTSSEGRRYVPIGFFPKEICVNNLVSIVPNATLFLFGILTSTMHNAWMRQVCGRLKSDYRYSNNLVYNNFPFPKSPTDKQIQKVEQTAQGILDAREKFPDATLADLYDPLTMPKELLDAHHANDVAVDLCYGRMRFNTDLERLEYLFALYRDYTEPLAMIEEDEKRKSKRRRKN